MRDLLFNLHFPLDEDCLQVQARFLRICLCALTRGSRFMINADFILPSSIA